METSKPVRIRPRGDRNQAAVTALVLNSPERNSSTRIDRRPPGNRLDAEQIDRGKVRVERHTFDDDPGRTPAALARNGPVPNCAGAAGDVELGVPVEKLSVLEGIGLVVDVRVLQLGPIAVPSEASGPAEPAVRLCRNRREIVIVHREMFAEQSPVIAQLPAPGSR